ncbi:MAG TPA: glycerol-3-phosphate dehydrogenase/oxidase [Candidatus Obscuribacterales bacterium]
MKPRSQALETAPLREFDLVVIGGGIVGAGIAQDAASRGMSVLLIEKNDFSSGTSSKTTKLIHGGLRYLEQFHFSLTRELCHERARLEQLAPQLVRDFSFVLPIAKEQRWMGLKANVGLTLYDFLARDANARRHVRLTQREVLESAPALSPNVVVSGLRFHDCITDDSRLVIEVVKSACQEGALAINYVEVTGFELTNNRVSAVKCHDRYSGKDFSVRARACVNAAGIWTDHLMSMIDSSWRPSVTPAKGIHIMVPQSSFETNTALFLPTLDKRYVFVVPWQRALMIGTTDTPYDGNIEIPLASADEVDYLLSVVNSYSGEKRINRSDVIASWAGLRPLVGGGTSGKDTRKMSREHLIFVGPGSVIGLIGGKLTNYRIMANQVVDKVLATIPELNSGSIKASRTARIMLGGFTDKQDFLTITAQVAAKARRNGIEPATLDHLIASYGKDSEVIVDMVQEDASLNQRICPDFPQIMAEIPFALLHESAVSLEDLLFRRTRLGMVHQGQCLEAVPKVARLVQACLGWDDTRMNVELEAVEQTIRDHFKSSHTQEHLLSPAAS